MGLRAVNQLRENVRELMRVRGLDQKSVSFALGHHPTWINKFLKGTRPIHVTDLDGLSDLFGLTVYQLFQPGISPLTERRKGKDRRSGRERRIGHAARMRMTLDGEISAAHPRRGEIRLTATEAAMVESFRRAQPHMQEGVLGILHAEQFEKMNPAKTERKSRQKGVANL